MIKSSSEQLNESKCGIKIEGDVLKILQQEELAVLNDVVKICEKENIKCFLAFGTLLGAIRHNGFIPWDDDIDVMISIDDIPNLLKSLKKEYGNKYFYNGLFADGDYIEPFKAVKIMKKNTQIIEIQNENWPYKRGVGIDIFPILSAPKSKFRRKLRYYHLSFLNRACTLTHELKYKPSTLLNASDKETRKYYKKRQRLGRLLSLIPYKKWISLRKKASLKTYKKSNNVSVGYSGLINNFSIKKKDFESSTKVLFESNYFEAPFDYLKFLVAWYGKTYNVVPDVSKREVHYVSFLSLNGVNVGANKS